MIPADARQKTGGSETRFTRTHGRHSKTTKIAALSAPTLQKLDVALQIFPPCGELQQSESLASPLYLFAVQLHSFLTSRDGVYG